MERRSQREATQELRCGPSGAARFGDWLVRELRGLIHAFAEQDGARALNPILARLKRACLLNEDADAAKARALAREILNDWDAITAVLYTYNLPYKILQTLR